MDPTDHTPAITGIFDHKEPLHPEAVAEEAPAAVPPTEATGYSKIGPGPMAAIRVKWTVRREDSGDYYVNETIGDTSLPIVTGPMSAEAAVRLVDDRERQALQRFERLKNEIVDRSADINPRRPNRDGA